MTPEEIRGFKRNSSREAASEQVWVGVEITNMLVEIAAQLAELNEKFADFFATDPTVYVPKQVGEENNGN